MQIKPIETIFRGYRMRSRLEARWAKFFQEIGIKWEYEKEGYESNNIKYLPDFWLPEQNTFLEIKGEMPSGKEIKKICMFKRGLDNKKGKWNKFYVIIGNPYIHGIDDDYKKEYNFYYIQKDSLDKMEDYYFMKCLQCNRIIISHFYQGWGTDGHMYYCSWCDIADRNTRGVPDLVTFHKGDLLTFKYMPLCGGLMDAYKAARQARFEHGEGG